MATSYKKDYKKNYKSSSYGSGAKATTSSTSKKSTLDNVNSQINSLEYRMKNSGIDVEDIRDSRNGLEKALNLPENQNFIFDLFEILNRPQQALFTAVDRGLSEGNALDGFMDGLTGKDTTSGGDIFRNHLGFKNEDKVEILGKDVGLSDVLGFTADVFLDPVDLLTVGSGTISDIAKAVDNSGLGKTANKFIDDGLTSFKNKNVQAILKNMPSSTSVAEQASNLKGKVSSELDDVLDLASKSSMEVQSKYVMEKSSELGYTIGDKIKQIYNVKDGVDRNISFSEIYMSTIFGGAKSVIGAGDALLGTILRKADDLEAQKMNILGTSHNSFSDWYKSLKESVVIAFNPLKKDNPELYKAIVKDKALSSILANDLKSVMSTCIDATVNIVGNESVANTLRKYISSDDNLVDAVARLVTLQREKTYARRVTIGELMDSARANKTILIPVSDKTMQSLADAFMLDNLSIANQIATKHLSADTFAKRMRNDAKFSGGVVSVLKDKQTGFEFFKFESLPDAITKGLGDEAVNIRSKVIEWDEYMTEIDKELLDQLNVIPEYQEYFNEVNNTYNFMQDKINSVALGLPSSLDNPGYVKHTLTAKADKFLKELMAEKANNNNLDNLTGQLHDYLYSAKYAQSREYIGSTAEANMQYRAKVDSYYKQRLAELNRQTVKDSVKIENLMREFDEYKDSNLFEESILTSMYNYADLTPKQVARQKTLHDIVANEVFAPLTEYVNHQKAINSLDDLIKKSQKIYNDKTSFSVKSPNLGEGGKAQTRVRYKANDSASRDEITKIVDDLQQQITLGKDSLVNADFISDLAKSGFAKHTDAFKNLKGKKLKTAIANSALENPTEFLHLMENTVAQLSKSEDTLEIANKLSGAVTGLSENQAFKEFMENYTELDKLKSAISGLGIDMDGVSFKDALNKYLDEIDKSENLVNEASQLMTSLKQESEYLLNPDNMVSIITNGNKVNRGKYSEYSVDHIVQRIKEARNIVNGTAYDRFGNFIEGTETTSLLDDAIKTISELDPTTMVAVDKRIARYLQVPDKKEVQALVKLFDAMTNFFKKNALLNVGFNARNAMGIYTNMYLSGVNPVECGVYIARANTYFKKYEQIKKKITALEKINKEGSAFVNDLLKGEITSGVETSKIAEIAGLTQEEIDIYRAVTGFLSEGFNGTTPMSQAIKGNISYSALSQDYNLDNVQARLQNAMKKGDLKLGEGALLSASSLYESAISLNMWGNETMDTLGRMGVYLKACDDPQYMARLGVSDAGEAVRMVMFDPFDLSDFERDYMRRIMPFYTFAKKNLEFQISNITKNTKQYHHLFKTYDKYLEFTEMEEMQDFKKENFYVPFPVADGNGKYYVLKTNLPVSDLGEWMSMGSAVQKAMSSINPLLKVPFEVVANKNTFTGLDIESYPGEKSDKFSLLTKKQEHLFSMTGLNSPLGVVRDTFEMGRQLIDPDYETQTGMLDWTGVLKQYDLEKDRVSNAYSELEELQNAVKYYKDIGVEIRTKRDIENDNKKYTDMYKRIKEMSKD